MAEGNHKDGASNDLTRRQWLLRLGHGIVLTGFSGAVGEIAADASAAPIPQAASRAGQILPPGLYLPNNDHLTHALTSDEQFRPIPARTETEYARPRTGPFIPRFFSADDFVTMRRLVELFLGEAPAASPKAGSGDTMNEIAEWIDLVVSEAPAVREEAKRLTPEQRAVAVQYFGAEAVEELQRSDPQRDWLGGLSWLQKECRVRFAKAFLDLSQDQQIQLLTVESQHQPKDPQRRSAERLFAVLKSQAIQGYYTSRQGLDELDYQGNTYHAECPGCAAGGDD